MNIDSVLKAVEEAKLYTEKFYDRAVTDKEVLDVMVKILNDKKEAELKKRFSQFGPEYLVASIEHLRSKK